MNCRDISLILPELARDAAARADERAEALLHIETCAECRFLLESQRSLAEKLGFLAAATELEAPPCVEERLRSAFRQSVAAGPVPIAGGEMKTIDRVFRAGIWAAGSIAAALLLILVLSGPGRTGSPRRSVAVSPHDSGSAARESSPAKDPSEIKVSSRTTRDSGGLAGESAAQKSSAQQHFPVRRVRGPVLRATAKAARLKPVDSGAQETSASEDKAEITSGFLSLSEDAASSGVDSGQLIRVRMPRSSLLSFGLPMNVERAAEPIQADILVGQDGRARAIRFVNFTRER